MTQQNPADYVIGPNATIDDINLDKEEIHFHGKRITEARAAELAEESRRLARQANLIPGRKSLSAGRRHSPKVEFRVSEATRVKLEAIAKRRHMTVSKLSREILDEYVTRETR